MNWSRGLFLAMALTTILILAGCVAPVAPVPEAAAPASAGEEMTYEDLVVGYAQIGAESEWRTANTKSIKDEAERLNVELKFSDAQQKQENQIKAIRSFIAQQVDVIGVSPVVETGWETVFQEAKDAGIPLILVDRRALPSRRISMLRIWVPTLWRRDAEQAWRWLSFWTALAASLNWLVQSDQRRPTIDSQVSARQSKSSPRWRLSPLNPVISLAPRARKLWKPS